MRLLSLVLIAGCSPDVADPADPAAVESPARIISLSPAVTEVIVAVGASGDLVGVDRFSRKNSGVGEDVPSLGALFSPDLERTVELGATLVFGVAGQQQGGFFDLLRSRGVRVETLSPNTLDEVLDSYVRIGELVGRGEAGTRLRDSVRAQLGEIRREVSDTPRSVAVVVEREPLYVVGGGSFVSSLIEAAGGRNVFGDLETAYPVVSLEVMVERSPEVLIDTSGVEGSWASLPGIGRVETVRQGVLTLPGARLPEAARLLRSRIHPGFSE